MKSDDVAAGDQSPAPLKREERSFHFYAECIGVLTDVTMLTSIIEYNSYEPETEIKLKRILRKNVILTNIHNNKV
jgi:hypothetical protein